MDGLTHKITPLMILTETHWIDALPQDSKALLRTGAVFLRKNPPQKVAT